MQSGGPVSAGASTPGRERPLVRPDDGPEVFDRYVAVFHQCLRDQGIAVGPGEKPQFEVNDGNRAAAARCEHLYPETWLDRERRTNPQFVDLLRQTAQCLLAKGHDVTVGGDPVAIMYGDNASANKAYGDERECERTAFRESVEKYNKVSGTGS